MWARQSLGTKWVTVPLEWMRCLNWQIAAWFLGDASLSLSPSLSQSVSQSPMKSPLKSSPLKTRTNVSNVTNANLQRGRAVLPEKALRNAISNTSFMKWSNYNFVPPIDTSNIIITTIQFFWLPGFPTTIMITLATYQIVTHWWCTAHAIECNQCMWVRVRRVLVRVIHNALHGVSPSGHCMVCIHSPRREW